MKTVEHDKYVKPCMSSLACCHRREEQSSVHAHVHHIICISDFMLISCICEPEGVKSACELRALRNMNVFPETETCHSRRRADIPSRANNSLIFCRLTVTLDLLAEELCVCSKAYCECMWSGNFVLFSKWFGGVLPALWQLCEAFHVFCHLADSDWCVIVANNEGG